jgi:hypothetical protein
MSVARNRKGTGMPVRIRLVSTILAVCGSCFAYADEAADAFNQVFGEEYKRATATPAPADDVALAKQLLDAAKAADKQLPLLALLCEKAYELGINGTVGRQGSREEGRLPRQVRRCQAA